MGLSNDELERLRKRREKLQSGSSNEGKKDDDRSSGSGNTLSASELDRIRKYRESKQSGSQRYSSLEVDDSYLDSFFRDSQDFLNDAKTSYNRLDYQSAVAESSKSYFDDLAKRENDLRNRATTIRDYMNTNRSRFDDESYKELASYLDIYSADSISKAFYDARDYYSQWETEDDWKAAYEAAQEYEKKSNLDTVAAQKEIAQLDSDLREYRDLTRWETDEQGKARAAEIRELYGVETERELESLLSQKKAYLNQSVRIQDGVKMAGVADSSSQYYDPEFDQYAQYADGGKMPLVPDYKDIVYGYMNDDQDAKNGYSLGVAWSRISGSEKDRIQAIQYMSPEEKAIYNYYYNKQGYDAAEAYFDSILEGLNSREASKMFAQMEGKTGLEMVFGIAAGFDQANSGLRSLFSGDDYIPASATQQASGLVRDDLKDVGAKLPDWMGGGSIGQGVYDAITTTTNMAPSIMTSAVVGIINPVAGVAVGNAVMGGSAAGSAYQEALNLGYDKGQARAYSTLIGASEVGLQYLLGGLGKLGGKMSSKAATSLASKFDNAYARLAVNYGMNMLSEGGEEYLQEVLTPLFKNLALKTDEEVSLISEEAIYSFLLGAVTSGVMEGTGISSENGKGLVGNLKDMSSKNQANIEALNLYGDSTAELIKEGLASDPKSESYQLAEMFDRKTKKKKSMTGYEIRQQVEANEAQFVVENYEEALPLAKQRLTELGETKDVDKIAKLVAKRASGQELTGAEKSALVRSQYGPKVAKEMTPSKATELTYKSLEKRIGTEGRFNVSESGKTTIRETGEEIDIKKLDVATVGEGQITFKVAEDKEVHAGDIDFADDTQSFLVSAVSDIENITPDAASVAIHSYDPSSGQTVGEYLNGFDEAFTYGYNKYSVEDMKAGDFTTNLSNELMMSAYKLGQVAKANSKTNNVEAIKRMRTAVQAATEKAVAEGKEAPKGKKLSITYNHGGGVIEDIATAVKKLDEELNEEQRGGIEAAKILHQMGIGTDYELFTSYYSKTLKDKDGNPLEVFLDDEGQEQAAYAGVYMAADGKIRINLNAYSGTKGLTLNALSHELTHFIKTWSLEKYEAMAEYLAKAYGEKGVSMHQLVLKEQDRLQKVRGGKEVSYGEAYDEVVANAFNRMLEDGKVMERIAEIRQVDKSLANKIIEGIRKFINRFTKVYRDNPSLFKETNALMEMKEVFEQLQNMFAEALVDASDNFQASLIAKEAGLDIAPVEATTQYSYQSLAEAAGFAAVENENGTRSFVRDGKAVSEVTVEDIENSPIGAFINFSVEMKDISAADAKRQKEMFAKICTMACKTNDFAMTMQFVGSAVFTGMKANADKQYGTTYDFPSICTKTQAVIDAMSAKMVSLGRGLTTDEIVQLYDDVFASGNPVPCPECYVFSRWIGIGGLLDNIKKYQDYYGDMDVEDVAAEYRKMKAEVSKFAEEQGISFGKAKGALTSKLTKEFNKLTEKIEKAENQGEKVKPADRVRLAELEPMMNTVKGMTWLENVYFADSSLKKVNPKFRVPNDVLFDLNNGEAFASQYKDAWAFRTTQGAGYGKAITPYAEARLGEGVLVTNNTTNAIKGRAQGTLDNYFLQQMGKLDKKSREALKRARMKQKIQAFIGGQRFQSASDARYENASDYLLAALEMQAMGGMVQCYTKVDGAVPAFSAWGFSINQSLMPLNGGLDADGNVQDTAVGGMKPSVAFENREKHETAGTITIGVNDNHIRAMFKQWVRDFIIPYHASGGKAAVVAEFRRIQEGKEAKGESVRSTDYSRTQSDKILSDEVLRWQGKTDAQIQRIHEIRAARIAILTGGKANMTVVRSNRFLSALYDKLNGGEWDGVKLAKSKVESQIYPNEFWDQTVSYDESAKITKDYLEYCEDLGFLHRFSGMIPSNGKLVPASGYNEKGERVQLTDLAYKYDENGNKTAEVEEFFWKVLTDRRMYDNNGNYLAQKVVTLNDTTAETVTGFAKNNQGRQYDKAKAEALAKKIVDNSFSGTDNKLIENQARGELSDNRRIRKGTAEDTGVSKADRERYSDNSGTAQEKKNWKDLSTSTRKRITSIVDNHIASSKNYEEFFDLLCHLANKSADEITDAQLRKAIRQISETIYSDAATMHPVIFENRWALFGDSVSKLRKDILEASQADSNDGAQYSTQQTDNITDRDMLANAFETISRNSSEYEMIQDYKSNVELLNKLERELDDVNREIRDIRFGTGKWDAEKLKLLESKSKQLTKEVTKYDQRLLNMEASAPLRRVIQQERKKEAERTKAHVQEIQQNKKLRAEQTELRHKIRNFKKKLEGKLLKPTDRQYVPVDLINAMVEVCGLIDTDTNQYNPDGSLNKAQAKRDETREKLRDLKDAYENLKTNSDPIYAGEFDEMVYEYLKELRYKFDGKSIKEMSLDELAEMYEILVAIDETLADARKLIGWGDAETVYEAGDSIVAEQNAITQKRKNGKRNAAQKGFDKIDNLGLSPVRNVERMSGYNQDSALLKLFKKFEQGIRKKNKFVMEAYKSFEALTSGKEYDEAMYKEVGGKKYEDVNGRKFGLSKMQMMQAILSYERETANKMSHIAGSGFSFADLDMLKKGNLRDAISEEYSHRVPSAVGMVAEFMETLKDDKWCQDYMAAARKFFNETAKNAINETSITLKHRIIAKDKNYIPFEVDKNFVVREISAENDIQQTINSYGMLKDITKGASQPLIITGLNNVLDRHIDQVGNVYGLAVEVRNFNKVWNVRSMDEVGNDPTVKTAVQRNWGVGGVKHIEQAVQDIQGPRVRERNALYDKIKSNYIGATFLLNLSVVTKQIGSLFSSTSLLKWRDPVRMIGNLAYTMANHKKISAEVDKYTATAWMRRQGMSDAELYTLMTQAKKPGLIRLLDKAPAIINPTKWITAMDHAVALSLWRYAKQDTAKRTGLKGEELLQATAEFYDEVIENTQSMTDVLHRPEIQKSGNPMSEAFAMFKTDLYQMAGQLQSTAGRYMAEKSKENGKALARTAYSIAMGAIWGQLMTTVFALLRYKVNQYRDDEDDELTMESWLKRQGFALVGDLMGYLFPIFGSETVGVFENIMYGEAYDVVDNIALTAINDLYSAMITLGSSIKDGEVPDAATIRKFAAKALQVFTPIPANNILRTLDAIQLHAEDIANGEFFSFNAGADSKTDKLYKAIIRGDTTYVGRIKSGYKTEESYTNAVRKALKENDPRIHDAAVAWNANNLDEYMRIAKQIIAEKHFTLDDVVTAIQSKANSLLPDDGTTTASKAKGLFTTEKFVEAIAKGDQTTAYAAKIDIIDTAKKNGKSEDEAEKSFVSSVKSEIKKRFLAGTITEDQVTDTLIDYCGESYEDAEEYVGQWAFEKEYGFTYSDRADAYKSGAISAAELRDILVNVGGKTEEDAMWQVKIYDWQKEGFDTDSKTVVEDYETFCKPAGINKNTYFNAYLFYEDSGVEGVKNSKVEECMPYIDSLPLSSYQKTELAKCWWAESTVNKYKTW